MVTPVSSLTIFLGILLPSNSYSVWLRVDIRCSKLQRYFVDDIQQFITPLRSTFF